MKIDVKFSENRFNAKFGEISEIRNGYPQEEVDSMVAAAEQRGNEAGRQAEYNRFWDAFTANGTRTMYPFAFAYSGLGEFMPPDKFEQTTLSYNMFYSSTFKRLPAGLRMPNLNTTQTGMYAWSREMFSWSSIEYLHDIEAGAPLEYVSTFRGCKKLITIEKVRVHESTRFDNTFQQCSSLTNITFDGVIGTNGLNLQDSASLTHDSLMSVINALQDKSADTSGTQWTLTIGSTNLAKLDPETELAIAWNKGWGVV